MGLFGLMQSASTAAHRTLAEISGMGPDDDGNTVLSGHARKYIVVYGASRVVEKMLTNGGYRKRTETLASMTRAQMATPPSVRTKVTRTDLTPQVEYIIDSVNTQDPLRWEMVFVNFGG